MSGAVVEVTEEIVRVEVVAGPTITVTESVPVVTETGPAQVTVQETVNQVVVTAPETVVVSEEVVQIVDVGVTDPLLTVKEDGVAVDSSVSAVDFIEPDADIITSSPPGEANVNLGGYARTPYLFDAIVDGIGTRPGHYAQITTAITAGKVHIAVLPKPGGGRYDAFTIASGDAARSVQGVGPGVLIGAPTVTKGDVLLKLLDSNGRVTLGTTLGIHRNITCERVYCDAAADTGFTIHPSADAAVLLSCRVVNTTGIALDFVSASRTFVFDFAVQECTGVNVIRAVNPDQVVLVNLNLSNALVAPTQDGILIQANGGPAALKLINASLAFTVAVASGYRCLRVDDIDGSNTSDIRLHNLDAVADDGLTPAIYVDNPAGLAIIDGLTFQGTHTAVIELPATSVSPTIIANASSYSSILVAYAALVTGSGKWQGKDNNLGALPTLKDRYQFTGLDPSADNLSGVQLGQLALAWAQAWAYIHGIKNYAEFWSVAAPANPVTSRSRLYQKTIDASNEGLFIKIKKAGAITEVQIA